MTERLPDWADSRLSDELARLRAQGEGQDLEFKREFPKQVDDIAKEIAAFATSNSGTILIGIDDSGTLVGLADCSNSKSRDALVKRIEGICHGSIKPALTPGIFWAIESGQIVLAIQVPKGRDPIYYTKGRPYLRHISSSRLAEPNEVIELIKNYLYTVEHAETDETEDESVFYSNLGESLHRVLLWAETPDDARNTNPWLEEWRRECSLEASQLEDLAATDVARHLSLSNRLIELAEHLEEFATFRLHMGCGERLNKLASKLEDCTKTLKRDIIDKIPLSERSLNKIGALLRESSRKVLNLADKFEQRLEAGREDDLKHEVSSIGSMLVEFSFWDLGKLGEGVSEELRAIGMDMRVVNRINTNISDGGASIARLKRNTLESAQRLAELVDNLNENA